MRREALIVALLIVVTLAIYLPNLGRSFLNWDLDAYHRILYGPVSLTVVKALFEDIRGIIVPGYYAPLASASLMLDRFILGTDLTNPWVTHLVNALFHCFNGALVYLLIRAVGGSLMVAGLGAFVFLAHPLQVPSVLWFAQRKTVLSASFYLLSYLFYLRARPDRSWLPYFASMGCFAAGLLAKPAIVTLPLVLFLTELLVPADKRSHRADPKDRGLNATGDSWRQQPELPSSLGHEGAVRAMVKALRWTAPFFALALVSGLLALGSEPSKGMDYPSLLERPLVVARTLLFYCTKALVPTGLQGIYPKWGLDFASFEWWLPLVLLLGLGAILIWYRRSLGSLVFWGLANFFIPLLPVSGILAFGYFQHSFVADHFAYVSMLGFGYLLGRAFEALLGFHRQMVRGVAILAPGAYCALLVYAAIAQAMLWKDSVTLWSANVKLNPQSWSVHANLGGALVQGGKSSQAIEHLQKAIELEPRKAAAYFSLVLALEMADRIPEAVEAGRRGIQQVPNYAPLHARLANVLTKAGELSEAEKHYRKALQLYPYFSDAYNDYGNMLEKAGRLPEAAEQFRLAIQFRPGFTLAYLNLGLAYEKLGNLPASVAMLRLAADQDPNNAEAQLNLGTLLLKAQDIQQAVVHLQNAVQIQPRNTRALSNLGAALLISGQAREAVPYFQRALELQPDLNEALANLDLALSRLSPDR